MPKVLNQRTAQPDELRNAVYVGRPSKWGNPFIIGKHGNRAEVVAKHREWVLSDDPRARELRAAARRELRGKDLVCWCAPAACHADTLLELANAD